MSAPAEALAEYLEAEAQDPYRRLGIALTQEQALLAADALRRLAPPDPAEALLETLSAGVHADWVASKRAQGATSRCGVDVFLLIEQARAAERLSEAHHEQIRRYFQNVHGKVSMNGVDVSAEMEALRARSAREGGH